MERLKNMSMKKALFTIAAVNLLAAAVLSLTAFLGCMTLRQMIAPQHIKIDIGTAPYTVTKTSVVSGQVFKMAELFSVLQILLPIFFFVLALVATVCFFWRLKLEEPLALLRGGAKRIMENDLDFSIPVRSEDELGQLCRVFETMRQSLAENNRALWRQAEERKRLNAAFSHDLRNPLTVLKGSVKMAKQCAEAGEKSTTKWKTEPGRENSIGGRDALLLENLNRIEEYTVRIERYVETMSSVGRLEQVQMEKKALNWRFLLRETENTLQFFTTECGKKISFTGTDADSDIFLDKNIFFQIMENLVSNAIRYAKCEVSVNLSCNDRMLTLEVEDDGTGFPGALLKNGIQPFQKYGDDTGHFGMGLYICSLLCEKHGGFLKIENTGQGARVCALLKIF